MGPTRPRQPPDLGPTWPRLLGVYPRQVAVVIVHLPVELGGIDQSRQELLATVAFALIRQLVEEAPPAPALVSDQVLQLLQARASGLSSKVAW